jgi:5-formyltetrahydrofolate cyclo-ligase
MLSTAKMQLRRRLREAMAGMTSGARADAAENLRKLIATLPCWQEARTVAAYVALPDEPDLRPLDWVPAKVLLLPRVESDALVFHRVTGPDDLQRGAFGVQEPRPGCPVADPAAADLILVPGLAFTPDGARLGRGRGFYDRALASLPPGVEKVGVSFHCRLLDQIPTGSHDARVDAVLTERGSA